MKVMVTGSTGFVGAAVVKSLTEKAGIEVLCAVRDSNLAATNNATSALIRCIDGEQDWTKILDRVDSIVHCAALVHVMNEQSPDPLTSYRRINVDGTLRLAKQAAQLGVRRFVFISSIKVCGEITGLGKPFTAQQTPAPIDAYGVSKWEAEQQLRAIAVETGMEVVIIRPVLVYGPGVKANFQNMIKWLHKGVPLPLGAIHNKRSLVSLDNLVDLIVTCIHHPDAANQTFLVSDGEDLSTTELLRRMARALGKHAHLLPLPARLLEAVATVLGKRSVSQRLCGSLQVDISHTRARLGWSPPVSVDVALKKTAEHFLEQQEK